MERMEKQHNFEARYVGLRTGGTAGRRLQALTLVCYCDLLKALVLAFGQALVR